VGYTHYWYTKRDTPPKLLTEAARKMLPIVRAGDGVLAGMDGTGLPHTGEDGSVRFNGRQDDEEDYESFTWPPNLGQEQQEGVDPAWVFDFCKTGGLRYDRFVVACLLAAKSVLGGALRVQSDGGTQAFSDSAVADLYARALDEMPPVVADRG
jgi:hypothetical protein